MTRNHIRLQQDKVAKTLSAEADGIFGCLCLPKCIAVLKADSKPTNFAHRSLSKFSSFVVSTVKRIYEYLPLIEVLLTLLRHNFNLHGIQRIITIWNTTHSRLIQHIGIKSSQALPLLSNSYSY